MNRPAPSSRRLVGVVAAAFLACLVLLAGPAAIGQESEPTRLAIRKIDATDPAAVQVSFIWNGERKALEDLGVREGGQTREHEPVVPLSKAGIETARVVVVDVSSSMGKNGGVAATQERLTALVDELEGGEAMGIVTFGSEVQVLSEITTDKADLRDAIDDIAAPSTNGTAMWDGLRRASGLFKPTSDLQPNIILITDGGDDQNRTTASEASSAVSAAGAAVWALAYDAENTVDVEGIQSLVNRVGGAVIPANGPEQLDAALSEVETSLANQFVVTFASSGEQGATDLELGVGGESVRTTFVSGAVSEGAGNLAPPSTSRSLLPAFVRGDAGLIVVVAVGGLAVVLAVVAVAMLATKDESNLDKVLQQYLEPGMAQGGPDDDSLAQTAFVQRAVEFTEDFAEQKGILVKIEAKLEQADLPLRAAEALFFYVVGALLVSVLGLALMGFVGLLFLGVPGFLLPMAILNFLGARRRKQFDSQLPDTLQLLAGSLRAGYSLVQGIDAVSKEVDGPMGRELRRLMTEAQLGRELEDALQASADRVQSKDFEWVIMAIAIQREVGGNLSELLMTVSDTMVGRERLRRDVSTLTAEGKVSAVILGIMPIALGMVMYVVNPSYMQILFSSTTGHVLLGVAALTMLIGFAWMKKCITIEV